MDSKSKTGLAVLGVAALAGVGALFLFPSKASAAPVASDVDNETPMTGPKNAQEAYGLAMNPTLRDPQKVLQLAQYLAQEGSHPEWAAAAQKRYYDLRAEELLGEGLKQTTQLARVHELAQQLLQTHNDYAVVLAMRERVQSGQETPPKSFQLPLLSGGSLVVDMSLYAPAASASSATPAPSFPSGTSTPNVVVIPAGEVITSKPPTTTVPANTPPLVVEETKPQNDPNGTIRLARLLLDEQAAKGWKYVSDAVKDWQKKVGLTADGKFGPGSALRMAEEVAILPWIRYWPTGSASKSSAVSSYRSRLKAYALRIQPTRPEHAASLIVAANKENGQGWPATPSVSPGSEPTAAQVIDAINELKLMKGSK